MRDATPGPPPNRYAKHALDKPPFVSITSEFSWPGFPPRRVPSDRRCPILLKNSFGGDFAGSERWPGDGKRLSIGPSIMLKLTFLGQTPSFSTVCPIPLKKSPLRR
jgi:hypothetical protein